MTSVNVICCAILRWTRSGRPDPDPEYVMLSSIMSLREKFRLVERVSSPLKETLWGTMIRGSFSFSPLTFVVAVVPVTADPPVVLPAPPPRRTILTWMGHLNVDSSRGGGGGVPTGAPADAPPVDSMTRILFLCRMATKTMAMLTSKMRMGRMMPRINSTLAAADTTSSLSTVAKVKVRLALQPSGSTQHLTAYSWAMAWDPWQKKGRSFGSRKCSSKQLREKHPVMTLIFIVKVELRFAAKN